MSNILADYREWREQQAIRVSTHSDGCHMWHKDCMIHRLADALAVEQAKRTPAEPSTPAEGTQQGDGTSEPVAWVAFADDASESGVPVLHRDETDEIAARHGWSVAPLYRSPTLTDAEREAIDWFASYGYSGDGVPGRHAATLRGLLERTQ